MKPEATIAVTRFKESDAMASRCIKSLLKQRNINLKVLFLDQSKSQKLQNLCEQLSTKYIEFKYIPIPAKSLSFARNKGLKRAQTSLVIFCDLDCTFEQNWADEIRDTFIDTEASIVGTKIVPKWPKRPHWYQKSRFILEFYSMLDLGAKRVPVNKIVGASFAVDKHKLGSNAHFDTNLGRSDGKLLGGEETDLCSRVINNGGLIYYTPNTYAHHWVEPYRVKLGWLFVRAYYGGYSRAKRGGKAESFNSKPSFRDLFAIGLIMPAYLLGRLKGNVQNTRTQ